MVWLAGSSAKAGAGNQPLPFERLEMRADGIIGKADLSNEVVHGSFPGAQGRNDAFASRIQKLFHFASEACANAKRRAIKSKTT